MDLTHSGTPIPDPFLAAVRRRHPDVDIVVLPPDPPHAPPTPDEQVGDDVVAEARLRTLGAARRLLSDIGRQTASGEVRERLSQADDGWVRSSARVAVQDAEPAILDDVHRSLAGQGWRTARPDDGLPRVLASRDGLAVTASHASTGTFLLVVDGTPLPVGAERATALIRGGDPR